MTWDCQPYLDTISCSCVGRLTAQCSQYGATSSNLLVTAKILTKQIIFKKSLQYFVINKTKIKYFGILKNFLSRRRVPS